MCLYTSVLVSESFRKHQCDSNWEKSVHLLGLSQKCKKKHTNSWQAATASNKCVLASPAKASLNVPDAVDKPERLGVKKPTSNVTVTPWPVASDSFLRSHQCLHGLSPSRICYNVYNIEESEVWSISSFHFSGHPAQPQELNAALGRQCLGGDGL